MAWLNWMRTEVVDVEDLIQGMTRILCIAF